MEWWCSLIGVTDRTAIAVATGVIAGGVLWIIGLALLWIVRAVMGRIVHLQ